MFHGQKKSIFQKYTCLTLSQADTSANRGKAKYLGLEGKHLVMPIKFSRKNTDGQEAKEKQTRIFQFEYCVQDKVDVCWLGLKVTVVAKSKNGLVKSCINKR